MNVSDAFALSRQIIYHDKSVLYAYFDAITFADGIENFLALTHEFLAQLSDTNAHQEFINLLYQEFINLLYQEIILPIINNIHKPNSDRSQPLEHSSFPAKKEQKADVLQNIHRLYDKGDGNLDIWFKSLPERDFNDEFYQAFYLNHWQDTVVNYGVDMCVDIDLWLDESGY